MQSLTYLEAKAWMSEHLKRDINSLPHPDLKDMPYLVRYVTPLETGRLKVLAERSMDRFEQTDLLFWVYDCEDWAWQEDETFPVFDACRRSFGENRDILTVQAHIATAEEFNEVSCLLQAILFYRWQAILCDVPVSKILNIGDGVFTFNSSSSDDFALAKEVYDWFHFKKF